MSVFTPIRFTPPANPPPGYICACSGLPYPGNTPQHTLSGCCCPPGCRCDRLARRGIHLPN